MTNEKIATRGIDVIFYTVQDMPRARAFYENLFDATPALQSDHWVEYELPDGATFALGMDPREGWKQGNGVMFGVPSVEEAVARATSLGGHLIDREFEGPNCKAAGIVDTEGNHLYVHQRK